MKLIAAMALAVLALGSGAALAQAKPGADKPADDMAILRDKIAADKKLVVSTAMELTDAQAKAFWPVYEAYQRDLNKINDEIATLVSSYAKDYNAQSLTDEKAKKLLDYYFAIEDRELKLRKSYVPKFTKVLPGLKAARYIQLENKVRALVKYELAAQIPLVNK